MRRVKVRADGFLRDVLRLNFAVFHLLRDRADGVLDLVAAAVVDAERRGRGIRAESVCDLVHLCDLCADILRQHAQITQNAHCNAALEHGLRRLLQIGAEQVHQRVDFVLRPLPVFGRERIDGKILHADVLAVGRNRAEGLRADLVACLARQTALFRPPAVAVHDDRDMLRNRTVFLHVLFLFSCKQSQPVSSPFLSLLR